MATVIGHEILNHLGRRITITARTLRRLDMDNFLRRDHESGLLQFKPELTHLYLEMGPDHELGPDFSGPNVCKCNCCECREQVEPDAGMISDIRTRQIVRDVTSHRKYL